MEILTFQAQMNFLLKKKTQKTKRQTASQLAVSS